MTTLWWWFTVVPAALAVGGALTETTIRLAAWWDARTYEPGDAAVKELRAELDDPVELSARWLCDR
jgi:hypothetical protein